MLKTGLSHGVAIVPNAPKQRYNCPDTGAHFEFEDMCVRLEKLERLRFLEESKSKKQKIQKDFVKKTAVISKESGVDKQNYNQYQEQIAQEAKPVSVIARAQMVKSELDDQEHIHMSE